MYARCVKNVRLPGTAARLCRCSERCLKYCSDDTRLPGMPGCPVCPVCPAVRLPGTMPGCPVCPELCPAARNYARLPGTMPGNMPGCPKCPVCPAVRLSGTMPGCPELCPAARLPGISTTATLGRPTPSVSGAAGDLRRSRRATARHHAKKSRPGQGPRQRRPLQSNVGRHGVAYMHEILLSIHKHDEFYCPKRRNGIA